MNRILFGCVILMLLSVSSVMEEKIIDVPDEMTIEMVVADENGYLDGTYDMRIRLYVPSTYERLWYQDLSNIDIVDGAFVISVNSNALIDAYELYNDDVKFVITIDDDTIEVPLLTYLYSYRSLFAEFGWDTRFPDVLYIDRTTGYFGFGTQAPKMYFDVNGALKLDYEITEVTGSIRWNTDTFEVLHPSGWVTLLYTPDSFIASRWTDYGDSIELTSSNYLIGINKTTPTEVLDIEGDVNFTGGFNVDSIVADSIQINSVELTDAGVTMASVELIDSSQTMFWTSANLYVNYGNVEGDGTGLTNIGALARDFDAQLITTSHLDDDVVASRNIKFQAIVSRNLMENDITMDRFVAKVFDSEHFGVNSISSENIISYSLSFDIISDEISVSDYIPDDFFTSSLIATDQIYATHIQEYSITSKNLQDDIFDGSHFRSNIVMVDHIENDSITYEKLATDAVQLSSFSGVIPIENGGTGLSAVHSGSVILMGDDQFDSQLNFRLDDSTGYFGLFDSDLSTIFSIVDDSSSVNIRLASTGDSVGVALENSAGLVDFKLDDDGYFNFNVGSSTWYLTEQGIMFDDPALDQYQFNLNSAITIAVAKNNEPNDGTIEFDELYPRFRFYDGSEWDLISTTGYGIGNPKQEGVVDIDVLDSFIGSVAQSNGWIEDSVIHQLSNSSIMGERMSIYRVDGSQIEGSQMMGSMVVDSVLISDDLIVDMSMDSMIRGQKLQVGQSVESELNGTASSVQGIYSSEVLANQSDVGRINDSTLVSYHSAIDMVSDSVVHSKESSLLNLDLVDLDVANSVVLDAAEVVVRGSGHYLDALLDVDVTGDRHSLFQVSFSQVEGYGNRLMNSSHSVVHGDANQVIGDDISIYGDNNLVVGSNQRIIGDGNISFYMGDDYQYIQEDSVVAFHAPNGVYFSTAPGMLVGATEMAGGWEHISDRNLKTGFSDVDHAEIFEQLMNLSISKWEYSFRKGVPHIGPMAQDFWSAFKLGEDERFITATDVDGIAFSAIKYMIDELDKSSGGVSFDTSQFDRFNELIMAADNTLSSLEKSLIMKNDALSVLVDSNLDQYIMLDKQFKVISRFKDVPSYQQLIMDGLVLVFCIIFGIFLGFILMTLYYKNDKGKGRYNGI